MPAVWRSSLAGAGTARSAPSWPLVHWLRPQPPETPSPFLACRGWWRPSRCPPCGRYTPTALLLRPHDSNGVETRPGEGQSDPCCSPAPPGVGVGALCPRPSQAQAAQRRSPAIRRPPAAAAAGRRTAAQHMQQHTAHSQPSIDSSTASVAQSSSVRSRSRKILQANLAGERSSPCYSCKSRGWIDRLRRCGRLTPVDRPAPAATADRFRCMAARSRPLKISCSG
jgi:hypothetical protein